MSTPVESFATATARGQEATASVLRSWADGLHAVTGARSALPDLPSMIDSYFEAVQRVLDNQRQFTEAVVSVMRSTQAGANQASVRPRT